MTPGEVDIMIINPTLENILKSADDLTVLCEIYDAEAYPPFDPANALDRFANGEYYFLGHHYKKLVKSFGNIKRTITPEINTASVDFDNLTREIAQFEFTHGFEGLLIVYRLISRSQSDALSKTMILFAGRCEKPDSGTKESLPVKAKYIVGATDVEIPRRKFSPEDQEGRVQSDPDFEGFIFIPQYGVTTYSARERRGGLLGFLGFKKAVTKNLPYSSYSDLDIDRAVPLVFGRVQMSGVHLGAVDVGTQIRMLTVFCEGEISDFLNIRSANLALPLSATSLAKLYGKKGVLNGPPDTNWVAPGYYSRSAHLRCQANNSQASTIEPAPNVIAVILGILMSRPNESNVWSGADWSDNPAAVTRFTLNSDDYHKLHANWIDDDSFSEAYRFNDEILFDTSFSDFLFVPNTTNFVELIEDKGNSYFLPTSSIRPDYWNFLKGNITASENFSATALAVDYDQSENVIPIEIPEEFPLPGGGTSSGLTFFLRRRYTFNGVATEQQKLTDFLHNVVFLASRMFLTQGADGRVRLRHKKPVDFAYVLTQTTEKTTSLDCDDISKWIADKTGYLLLDPGTTESEVKTVTSADYSTAQNSVSISASANITVSGFSGCNGADIPATATLTVDTVNAGNDSSFSLAGITISFRPTTADSTATMAQFIYATINAHPLLKRQFVAVVSESIVTIKGKFGVLTTAPNLLFTHSAPLSDPTVAPVLTAVSGGAMKAGAYRVAYSYQNNRGQTLLSPFAEVTLTANQKISVGAITPPATASVNWFCVPAENSRKLRFFKNNSGQSQTIDLTDLPRLSAELPPDQNKTGAEVLRVAQVFSDRAERTEPRTALTRSNVLKSSYKWMLGNRESATNQIALKFRDAVNDWKLTELRLRDDAHIKKTKKISKKEFNGQGIDNYNQAYRIASGLLAELRDADFFYQWTADRVALLLEEGDVVCVTDDGAGLINFPVRIETIEFAPDKGFVKATFTARKYATSLYDDSVAERQIPVITEQNSNGFSSFAGMSGASTDIIFDGTDTVKRLTISDVAISEDSKIIAALRRPDTDEENDAGYIYILSIVKIENGSFDVVVNCLNGDNNPPNETLNIFYLLG